MKNGFREGIKIYDIKIVQTKMVWAFLILSIETIIIEGTEQVERSELAPCNRKRNNRTGLVTGGNRVAE